MYCSRKEKRLPQLRKLQNEPANDRACTRGAVTIGRPESMPTIEMNRRITSNLPNKLRVRNKYPKETAATNPSFVTLFVISNIPQLAVNIWHHVTTHLLPTHSKLFLHCSGKVSLVYTNWPVKQVGKQTTSIPFGWQSLFCPHQRTGSVAEESQCKQVHLRNYRPLLKAEGAISTVCTTATRTAGHFHGTFCGHLHRNFHCPNGQQPQSTSNSFASSCEELGVKMGATTEYRLWTNRKVERFKVTIISRLQYYLEEYQQGQGSFLFHLTYAWNLHVYHTIKLSVFSLLISQVPSRPANIALQCRQRSARYICPSFTDLDWLTKRQYCGRWQTSHTRKCKYDTERLQWKRPIQVTLWKKWLCLHRASLPNGLGCRSYRLKMIRKDFITLSCTTKNHHRRTQLCKDLLKQCLKHCVNEPFDRSYQRSKDWIDTHA